MHDSTIKDYEGNTCAMIWAKYKTYFMKDMPEEFFHDKNLTNNLNQTVKDIYFLNS